ncbi:hypothetical protein [Paeniglutamicibacter antarcticus]
MSTPAIAYFASGGSGADIAATGTLKPMEILPATTGTSTARLYPGKTGDLIVKVKNPNAIPVTLLRASQGGGVSVTGAAGCTNDSGWPTTVGTSGVSMPEAVALDIELAGGSTKVLHLPGAASMSLTSAAGCQGATFDIPITVEVKQ